MTRDTGNGYLTLLSVGIAIGMNAFANTARWGGKTTGEVSASYPTLITPASYAFAIWSVIYLGLILFALWQILPAQLNSPILRRVRWPVIMSCAANGTWVYLWHHGYVAHSFIAISALLATLTGINRILDLRKPESKAERWLLRGTFATYFGWVTVATAVNAAVSLVALGWQGGGIQQHNWAVVVILTAATICSWLTYQRLDVFYALTVVWAFVAIAVAQHTHPIIASAAAGASAAVVSAYYIRLRGSTSIVSPIRSV